MPDEPTLLDTDTLSELSRGHPVVQERARAYLTRFGRLTISSVTVFERLRGYRAALRQGKPYERHLQAFEALVAHSLVLPFDDEASRVAATIWAGVSPRQRQKLGDLLIAGIAVSRGLQLATRNQRDFARLLSASSVDLALVDWSRPPAPVSNRPPQ